MNLGTFLRGAAAPLVAAAALAIVPAALAATALPAAPAIPAVPGVAAAQAVGSATQAVGSAQSAVSARTHTIVVHVKLPRRWLLPGTSRAKRHTAPSKACLRTLASSITVTVPIAYSQFDPCTGDVVTVTGTENLVINTVVDGSGGHLYLQQAWQNTSGIGMPSGTKYQGNDTTHQFERDFVIGQRTDLRIDDEFELVSENRLSNWYIRSHADIQIDENGDPISASVYYDADCSP